MCNENFEKKEKKNSFTLNHFLEMSFSEKRENIRTVKRKKTTKINFSLLMQKADRNIGF